MIDAYQGSLSRVHTISNRHLHHPQRLKVPTGAFVSLLRYPGVPWHVIWEPWPREVKSY